MAPALLILVSVLPAWAQQPEPIKLAEETRLTWGKQQEFKFDIAKAPDGYRALVSFLGRQDAKGLGGSAHMLALHLNGTRLTGERLANKDSELVMGSGAIGHWFGGRGWRLLYSPDYEQGDGPGDHASCIVTGKAYEFLIDVTDLLKPGENRLAARHVWDGPWNDVVLKDLAVMFRKPEMLYSKPGIAPEAPKGPLPFITPAVSHRVDFTTEIEPDGVIVLKCGSNAYRIESDFTHKASWEIKEARGTRMHAVCKQYELVREIRPQAECLNISDAITNRTNEDIGVFVQHTCRFDPAKAKEYRVGGLKPYVSAMRSHSTGNQTTFVSLEGGGLGLLPRDDVLKAHADNYYDKGAIGLEDRFFALPAGKSYTLRWSVFPVPSGDYYDFVNAARRTLDVNFTFDGPMGFAHYVRWMENITPEDARQWAETRSLKYISGVIPSNPKTGRYYHGSAMLLPEARPRLQLFRDLISRIQKERPGSFGIPYFHCYISTEPGAAEKYKDSVALDAAGKQQDYHNPIYPLFIPTLSNSYGKAMQDVLNLLLDGIKFDGIYWDEMSQSCGRFVYDFPEWDGHTAQINKDDGTIVRKMSEVTLISQPFREGMVKRITANGRPLIANGPPVTETMMKRHFPRFTETGGLTHLCNVHLFTPIGLGDHLTEKTPLDIARQIRRHLDYGCVYYYYHFEPRFDHYMLPHYMYPITPMELHEGYIIAKERILTNRPGTYGWGDRSGHEVHVFDDKGKEVPFETKTFEKDGAVWTELRLPTHYAAAIVRKDARQAQESKPSRKENVMSAESRELEARPVTRGPIHHFFGYYDKFPWDATGRYMLALETKFIDRPPTPDDTATIGLIDTANDNAWKPLAETHAWNWQQGTMLHWLPTAPDRWIIYNDRQDGRFVAVKRDIQTGETRILPRPIYAISRDGRQAVSLNFARVHRNRPGYGYVGVADPWKDEPHPAQDGIYWMNLETGENRLIISLDQIVKIRHDETMDGVQHWFNHLQFNADGTRFLFLHRWRTGDGKRWLTRLFTANPDGSDICCVADHGMTSHFDWRNAKQILAWSRQKDIGDRFFLFTDQTGEREVVGEGILTADGHCSYSPDGQWILNDTYPAREDHKRTLMLYHPATRRRIDIGRFYAPPELGGEIRCDLHPRWSRDGRLVCLDSAHEKCRQIYVIDVSKIVSP